MAESRFDGVSGMLNYLLVILASLTVFELGSASGDSMLDLPDRLTLPVSIESPFASQCDANKALPQDVVAYISFAETCLLAPRSIDMRQQDVLQMFHRLNAVRERNQLPPLAWHEGAAEAARIHAVDMIRRDYFNHTSPEGLRAADRLQRIDRSVLVSMAGENLARYQAGWPNDYSEDTLQTNLENSPRHLDNMLNPDFSHVGIAVVHRGSVYIGVQVFIDHDGELLEAWPTILHTGDAFNLPTTLEGRDVTGWRLVTDSGKVVARAYDTHVEIPETDADQLELNVMRRVSRTMDDVLIAPVSNLE